MSVPPVVLPITTALLAADGVRCPDCGGALDVTEATAVDLYYGANRTTDAGPRRVERHTTVAACTHCEFLLDLREAVRR